MYPEVRVYADPFEGLAVQLTELRGLIKLVPPLIEADRERRWKEISERPSDGEDGDIIDLYEAEAGPEEGWGHADFGRTIRVAAIVTAWAAFHDYLTHELRNGFLSADLSAHPQLAQLVEDETRRWDRRFDDIARRYQDFARIKLSELPSWPAVLHARELRNALVHNQGQHTRAYLNTKLAYRPTKDDLAGFTPPADASDLINRELIPLSYELADSMIVHLRTAATEVRAALDSAP